MIRTLLWEGEDQKAMSLLVDLAYRLVVDINTGDGVNIFEDFYLEDYEMFTRFLNESIESEALLTDFQYILLTNLILYENETTRLFEPSYFYDGLLPVRDTQIKEIAETLNDSDFGNGDYLTTEWKSLTAASYAFIQECTRAEKYHNESFKIVKDEGIENYTTDTYFVPLTIGSCYALIKNKDKLKKFNDEFKEISENSKLQNEIPTISRLYSIILDAHYFYLNKDLNRATERLSYFSEVLSKTLPSGTYSEFFDNMIYLYLKIYDQLKSRLDDSILDPITIKKIKKDIFLLETIETKKRAEDNNDLSKRKKYS